MSFMTPRSKSRNYAEADTVEEREMKTTALLMFGFLTAGALQMMQKRPVFVHVVLSRLVYSLYL